MIREIKKNEKKAFNKAASHPLQSWEWGEFREKTGNKILRLGVFKDKKLIEAITLTIHPIPRSYFNIAAYIKGPEPTKEIIKYLQKLAKERHLIFTKLEPNIEKSEKLTKFLRQNGAVPGKTLFTPTTFVIDLTKNEGTLLKEFSSKTRYNIRLAEKRGVKIQEDNSDEAFEQYLRLTRETVERQRFYAHSEMYHRKMWETLHIEMKKKKQKPIARLLTAKYEGQIITTWIIFVWHDTMYYPYGASTSMFKNLMANNLMMWGAIKYGKKLRLKKFDLWGREEGKGFTKFKEGYNPKVVEFIGTWDLPTSPSYYPYRAADTLRWVYLRAKSKFAKPKF